MAASIPTPAGPPIAVSAAPVERRSRPAQIALACANLMREFFSPKSLYHKNLQTFAHENPLTPPCNERH